MNARIAFLWGLAGMLGLWAGFPNGLAQLPPLALLFPLALFRLGAASPGAGAAFRRGWLCGMASALAVMYWVARPVHVVGGLPWPLAGACALLVSAGLGLAGGVFAWAAYRLRGRPPVRRACLLGIAWYLLEHVCALVFSFPWFPLAAALAAWPVCIQPAAVLGAYAVSGLYAMLILLLADCRGSRAARGAAMLLAAVLLLPAAWRLHAHPAEALPQGPDTAAVLFVEGNIDQNRKWDPAFQLQTVDTYLALTRQGLAAMPGERPLVIWPETAMPFHFQSHPLHTPRILEFAAQQRTPMLIGAPGYARRPGQPRADIFNRAFLISPQGQITGFYDKQYLVPFGEYLPAWLDIDVLRPLLQGVGIYSRGTDSSPLHAGELALGMLICYEAIFPELAAEAVTAGANVLADISNDGWFGATAAPVQHLYLAALRAVEQGRWLLRGTNTGISAVCDAYGRIVTKGRRDTAEAVPARVRMLSDTTVFHALGPWMPLLAICLFLLLAALPAGRERPTL